VAPSSGGLILGALFFGACAAVLFYMSRTSNGVVINGLIELSPENGRIFLLAMTALSLGFVGMALFVVLRGNVKELVIEDEAIAVPTAAWKRTPPKTFSFADVVGVNEKKISGQVILTLRTHDDRADIVKSHLPEGAYEEVLALVTSRLRR
jgi:hypothetical protein